MTVPASSGLAPGVGRSGAGLALGLICSAQFVLQLDFSIVNVALPSIQRELGLVASQLQWIVTGYALTFGSLLLLGGRAADLLGRRRLLVAGLALFAIASLGAGLAQSSLVLIVARMVQGAAGAMVSPAALSLLTTMNADGPARNRALGIWQASTAAGATTGIIAGGVLTQAFDWRAIFLVNPPLIGALLLLLPRVLPASPPEGGRRIDGRGAVLATGALAAFIFGLSNGQQHGFTAPLTLITLAGAIVLAVAFVLTERTVDQSMLPLEIFADPTRRAAVEAMVLIGAILAGYVYFVSLYLQRVAGFTPIATGLALVPSTGTLILTSTFLTRRLLGQLGVKPILIAGLASMAAGQLWLAQISAGASYPGAVLPGLLFTSFGFGLALPAASVAITSRVEKRDQGLAGSLFVTGQQIGAAIGLAVLATLAASRATHAHGSLTAGYRFSFLIATCLALAAIVLVATQASSPVCQRELARQQRETGDPNAMASAEARRADREWPLTGDEPESGAASPA
ncbi:MAG TPA: MFS transporter [Solirubrobacteraceae bacterium]|nr:MFS transporter [Solirubrobacteraceae bacterium]